MQRHKLLPLALAAATHTGALAADDMARCMALNDDDDRLACYDDLAGREPQPQEDAAESVLPPGEEPEGLYAQRVEEEKEEANNPWVIIPHYRNYLLPVTYNAEFNDDLWTQLHPESDPDDVEIKFQVSFKALIRDEPLGEGTRLWGAYTQESWWQAYNSAESRPFRETNYQPEIFLSVDNDWEIFGFTNTLLAVSLNHQSNGRSDPLSRSWNRVIGTALFERGNFSVAARTWYRIPEDEEDDDNPDLQDYLGYGDLEAVWKWDQQAFGVTLRNVVEGGGDGAVQLDWTFPLPGTRRFRGYLQYYYGYGESLIDYDATTNRIGAGVVLTDLL